jgi:hypothetical protein
MFSGTFNQTGHYDVVACDDMTESRTTKIKRNSYLTLKRLIEISTLLICS